MPAKDVKAYVKRNKNDAADASGPAATAAASRRGKPLREKQAAYMAAPERFAER
jgi:hypothetical protein